MPLARLGRGSRRRGRRLGRTPGIRLHADDDRRRHERRLGGGRGVRGGRRLGGGRHRHLAAVGVDRLTGVVPVLPGVVEGIALGHAERRDDVAGVTVVALELDGSDIDGRAGVLARVAIQVTDGHLVLGVGLGRAGGVGSHRGEDERTEGEHHDHADRLTSA